MSRRRYVPRKFTLIERLDYFAIKPADDPNACWGWSAFLDKKGFPRMRWDGRPGKQAVRLAYVARVGRIPKGRCVRQRCLSRACTNPRHLFTSTITRRNRDREIFGQGKIGGRKRAGELHPNHKLTEKIVQRVLTDRRTTAAIARQHKVDWSTIDAIRQRKNWRHVEVPT